MIRPWLCSLLRESRLTLRVTEELDMGEAKERTRYAARYAVRYTARYAVTRISQCASPRQGGHGSKKYICVRQIGASNIQATPCL